MGMLRQSHQMAYHRLFSHRPRFVTQESSYPYGASGCESWARARDGYGLGSMIPDGWEGAARCEKENASLVEYMIGNNIVQLSLIMRQKRSGPSVSMILLRGTLRMTL